MPSATTSTHLSPAELSYLHTSLSSHPPIRPDARLATDFRPLNAETGILPNTMGSAHVGFADGREAVVGIRAEVEKTPQRYTNRYDQDSGVTEDTEMQDVGQESPRRRQGRSEWITLSLTLPGMRDDDKELVFLEETLREVLVSSSSSSTPTSADQAGATSLQDALDINRRWHWHLYIDILLLSPPDSVSSSSGSGSSSASTSPLPLLSMAVYFALRDTRIPRLKSEGDEDPVADDDWEASTHLYSPATSSMSSNSLSLIQHGLTPPVTLLVMSVAENIIFDPSSTELAVADGVWAVSVGRSSTVKPTPAMSNQERKIDIKILNIRMLDTSARDTMKGVPRDTNLDASTSTNQTTSADLGSGTDQVVPGVWKPKVGGVKRQVIMQMLKAVTGKDGEGVGREILDSLDSFLIKSG